MVQVVGAVVSGQAVRYTLQPVGDWCAPKMYCDEEGCFTADQIRWTTEYREAFDVNYQVRKRVVLKGNASPLADTAMARHYSWWYDGLRGKPARCQVHGNRARCEAMDGIGDSYVKAVVKIRLVPRAGQKPVWSYRLSARQIDEYCVYVEPKTGCVTRIKKRRSRVALPSWVRARTVG